MCGKDEEVRVGESAQVIISNSSEDVPASGECKENTRSRVGVVGLNEDSFLP